MKKHLILSFLLIPMTSLACGHDVHLSSPAMHNKDAIITALEQSKGKQPKLFDLKNVKSKDSIHNLKDNHNHSHNHAPTTLVDKSG